MNAISKRTNVRIIFDQRRQYQMQNFTHSFRDHSFRLWNFEKCIREYLIANINHISKFNIDARQFWFAKFDVFFEKIFNHVSINIFVIVVKYNRETTTMKWFYRDVRKTNAVENKHKHATSLNQSIKTTRYRENIDNFSNN